MAQAVAKANNKEVTVEFEKITKALKETGQISEVCNIASTFYQLQVFDYLNFF